MTSQSLEKYISWKVELNPDYPMSLKNVHVIQIVESKNQTTLWLNGKQIWKPDNHSSQKSRSQLMAIAIGAIHEQDNLKAINSWQYTYDLLQEHGDIIATNCQIWSGGKVETYVLVQGFHSKKQENNNLSASQENE